MFRRNKSGKNGKNKSKKPGTLQNFTREELQNPENAEVYLRRGLALWKQGNHEKIWIELMNSTRLLERDYLAGNYRQQSDVDAPLIQAAIALAVDFTYLGMLCNKNEKYEKAISLFDSAITLLDDYTPAYNNRGKAYFLQGSFLKALEDFNKAVTTNPQIASTHNNRAIAHLALQKFDEALADANKAIELDNASAMFYNNRGLIHQQQNQHQQAIDDFTLATVLDPALDVAYLSRAVSWYLMKKKDDARHDIKTFQDIRGNLASFDSEAELFKALLQEQSGDFMTPPEIKQLIIMLDDLPPTKENYQHRLHITPQERQAAFNDPSINNPGILNAQHPANQPLLKYMRDVRAKRSKQYPLSSSPTKAQPEGSHPDLVDEIWGKFTRKLPVSCKWIVYGFPVLINPNTGVIFAYAIGTFNIYLRLPENGRNALPDNQNLSRGMNVQIAPELASDWVIALFTKGQEYYSLLSYKYAGTL